MASNGVNGGERHASSQNDDLWSYVSKSQVLLEKTKQGVPLTQVALELDRQPHVRRLLDLRPDMQRGPPTSPLRFSASDSKVESAAQSWMDGVRSRRGLDCHTSGTWTAGGSNGPSGVSVGRGGTASSSSSLYSAAGSGTPSRGLTTAGSFGMGVHMPMSLMQGSAARSLPPLPIPHAVGVKGQSMHADEPDGDDTGSGWDHSAHDVEPAIPRWTLPHRNPALSIRPETTAHARALEPVVSAVGRRWEQVKVEMDGKRRVAVEEEERRIRRDHARRRMEAERGQRIRAVAGGGRSSGATSLSHSPDVHARTPTRAHGIGPLSQEEAAPKSTSPGAVRRVSPVKTVRKGDGTELTFNASPGSPLYYGSLIALESLDGWFLTVHPTTGVVSVREGEARWMDEGRMPFTSKVDVLAGTVCRVPLYLFRVVDLKKPERQDLVCGGDTVWFAVVQGRGASGWTTGSVLAPYLHAGIPLDGEAVDVDGHAKGHGLIHRMDALPAGSEAAAMASARGLIGDVDDPARSTGAADLTFGMPLAAKRAVKGVPASAKGVFPHQHAHEEEEPWRKLAAAALYSAGPSVARASVSRKAMALVSSSDGLPSSLGMLLEGRGESTGGVARGTGRAAVHAQADAADSAETGTLPSSASGIGSADRFDHNLAAFTRYALQLGSPCLEDIPIHERPILGQPIALPAGNTTKEGAGQASTAPGALTFLQSLYREAHATVGLGLRLNPLDRLQLPSVAKPGWDGLSPLGIPRPLVAHVPPYKDREDFLRGPASQGNPYGVYRRGDPGFDVLYETANGAAIILGSWRLQKAGKEVTADGLIVGGLGVEGQASEAVAAAVARKAGFNKAMDTEKPRRRAGELDVSLLMGDGGKRRGVRASTRGGGGGPMGDVDVPVQTLGGGSLEHARGPNLRNFDLVYAEQAYAYLAYVPGRPGAEAVPGFDRPPEVSYAGHAPSQRPLMPQAQCSPGAHTGSSGPGGDESGGEPQPSGPTQAKAQAQSLPAGFVQDSCVHTHMRQEKDGCSGGNRRDTLMVVHRPGANRAYKVDRRGVFRIRMLQNSSVALAVGGEPEDSPTAATDEGEGVRGEEKATEAALAGAAAKEAVSSALKRANGSSRTSDDVAIMVRARTQLNAVSRLVMGKAVDLATAAESGGGGGKGDGEGEGAGSDELPTARPIKGDRTAGVNLAKLSRQASLEARAHADATFLSHEKAKFSSLSSWAVAKRVDTGKRLAADAAAVAEFARGRVLALSGKDLAMAYGRPPVVVDEHTARRVEEGEVEGEWEDIEAGDEPTVRHAGPEPEPEQQEDLRSGGSIAGRALHSSTRRGAVRHSSPPRLGFMEELLPNPEVTLSTMQAMDASLTDLHKMLDATEEIRSRLKMRGAVGKLKVELVSQGHAQEHNTPS